MCTIDIEYFSEVWRETPHVATKTHRCDCCLVVVKPGEPYLFHFSVFEGFETKEKMCFECWCARQQFSEAHGYMMPPGSLEPMLGDCINDGDESEAQQWQAVLDDISNRRRNRVE